LVTKILHTFLYTNCSGAGRAKLHAEAQLGSLCRFSLQTQIDHVHRLNIGGGKRSCGMQFL